MDTKPILINRILGDTEDEQILFWGENNYARLMNTLIQCLNQTPTYQQNLDKLLDETYLAQNLFVWSKDYSFSFFGIPPQGTNYYKVKLHPNADIEVVRNYITDIVYEPAVFHDEQGSWQAQWAETAPKKLAPFEPIAFINSSSLGMLNEAGAQEGKLLIVPALFLKYAADKRWNMQIFDGIMITVDLATLATGAGSWIKAAQLAHKAMLARRAWVLFEVGNAVGNLAITTKTIENKTFKNLVEYQDLLMLGLGLKNLGKVSIQQAVQLAKEAQKINWQDAQTYLALWDKVRKNHKLMQQLSQETKNKIITFVDILKKEYRKIHNYELKPLQGAVFTGFWLEIKKIITHPDALKKLQQLSDKELKLFYQDIKKSDQGRALREVINKEPELVDAWKKAKDYPDIRKEPHILKFIEAPYPPVGVSTGAKIPYEDAAQDIAKINENHQIAKKNKRLEQFLSGKTTSGM